MVTYKDIFVTKQRFTINRNPSISNSQQYQFILNESKGEFIDTEGRVLSQLLEANPNDDWFMVMGLFMEDLVIRPIFYSDINLLEASLSQFSSIIDNKILPPQSSENYNSFENYINLKPTPDKLNWASLNKSDKGDYEVNDFKFNWRSDGN